MTETEKVVRRSIETRLYSYPVLRAKVAEDRAQLQRLQTEGTPENSKSIVRYSRTGYRATPEEMRDAVIRDLETIIAADEYEIETLEKALQFIEKDKYYFVIEGKHIKGLADEAIADHLHCDTTTIWRNRNRLMAQLAVCLYGVAGHGLVGTSP